VIKPDAIDAERFRAMLESPSFWMLTSRMHAELNRASGACERAEGDVELRRAQGAAAAWRVVVALPASMLAEMKKSGGEKR
jgi:hypothetical protein